MTTGPIPVTLPRVSAHTQPAATQANTPVTADPHLTRDVQVTARAVTAADKTDNPVSDRLRQREGERQRGDKSSATRQQRTGLDTGHGPTEAASVNPVAPGGPVQTRAFEEVLQAGQAPLPTLDTFA